MIYKTFQKVSNVCQLLDKSKYPATKTTNGVTFTNNGDGSYTLNGTATPARATIIMYDRIQIINNHIYLLTIGSTGSYTKKYFINSYFVTGEWTFVKDNICFGGVGGIIYTGIDNVFARVQLAVEPNTTVNNLVFKPQLFDLTEMYGAGNEPTTVEQFRQDFPEEMYDYSPYCFVKSYRTLLKVSNVCQVLDKSKYPATQTIDGVTFTNNGDGTITVNGTCTNPYYSAYKIRENLYGIISGHKYAILGTGTNVSVAFTAVYQGGYIWKVANNIFTLPKNEYTGFGSQIRVTAGVSVSNITVKPQLFDLTEMYGAGNEPTTVEQFRQDFPEEIYDYKPYSIIPSYKKSLVCKTKNLFDISKVTQSNKIRLNDKDIICSSYGSSIGLLKNLCPSLKAGDIVTLSLIVKSTTSVPPTFVQIQGQILNYAIGAGSVTFTVTEDGLNSDFYLYNTTFENMNVPTTTVFTDIMIELGNTATDYVPYGHL